MKIILGYDGSGCAREALEVAARHAGAHGAQVEILTSMVQGREGDRDSIRKAERDLEAARERLEGQGIESKTHLLIRGMTPGEDLVQFAAEQGADLVVVGVKRRSRVGKLLLGSTAQYVILNAPCPVLTVR